MNSKPTEEQIRYIMDICETLGLRFDERNASREDAEKFINMYGGMYNRITFDNWNKKNWIDKLI